MQPRPAGGAPLQHGHLRAARGVRTARTGRRVREGVVDAERLHSVLSLLLLPVLHGAAGAKVAADTKPEQGGAGEVCEQPEDLLRGRPAGAGAAPVVPQEACRSSHKGRPNEVMGLGCGDQDVRGGPVQGLQPDVQRSTRDVVQRISLREPRGQTEVRSWRAHRIRRRESTPRLRRETDARGELQRRPSARPSWREVPTPSALPRDGADTRVGG